MSHCCSSSRPDAGQPSKRHCPACSTECVEVSSRTIAHHIRFSWRWAPSAEGYYFCDNPDCDTAYFGDDGSVISKTALRVPSAVKDKKGEALLCHCFGVSRADFEREPSVRDFVVEQTKAGSCSCETSNPSGRCCLKDFPKSKG